MPKIKKIPWRRDPLYRPGSMNERINLSPTNLYSEPKLFYRNIKTHLNSSLEPPRNFGKSITATSSIDWEIRGKKLSNNSLNAIPIITMSSLKSHYTCTGTMNETAVNFNWNVKKFQHNRRKRFRKGRFTSKPLGKKGIENLQKKLMHMKRKRGCKLQSVYNSPNRFSSL